MREDQEGLGSEHAEDVDGQQQYGDVYEPEGQDDADYPIDTYDDVTAEREAGECSVPVPFIVLFHKPHLIQHAPIPATQSMLQRTLSNIGGATHGVKSTCNAC